MKARRPPTTITTAKKKRMPTLNERIQQGVKVIDHETGLTWVREGDGWVCRTSYWSPRIKCRYCDALCHPADMFQDDDEPTDCCQKCNDQDWLCEGCEVEFNDKPGHPSFHEDRNGDKWCDGCFQEKMTCSGCGDDCGASGGIDQDDLFLPHDADGINRTGRAKCEDCLGHAAKERLKALREARKPIITAGDAYEALVAMP